MLVPSKSWSPSEIEAVEAGAKSMPAAFFDEVSRPIFVERRAKKCPFGQGSYDRDCPSFDARQRTFYLYDVAPPPRRFTARLMPGLDPVARRRLFYKRAIIHLVVALLDRKLGWSEQSRWRQINGWDGGEPLNQDLWGYSRPLGRRSAHLDLVTFAEEYFARPQGLERDDSIECRMMTRSRIFGDFVARLAPRWRPGRGVEQTVARPVEASAATGCPAFDEWLDLPNWKAMSLSSSA